MFCQVHNRLDYILVAVLRDMKFALCTICEYLNFSQIRTHITIKMKRTSVRVNSVEAQLSPKHAHNFTLIYYYLLYGTAYGVFCFRRT